MQRIHIVSNRLPYHAAKVGDDFKFTPSVGGLATGVKSIYKHYEGKWIGWPGIAADDLHGTDQERIEHALDAENCVPVHLTQAEINDYYEGFSNETIWPLFHYFTEFAEYRQEHWDAYVRVNRKFADAVLAVAAAGDVIWVHDYQLLLVPGMIKDASPDVTIGAFLHIPFPSFEVFRVLPWRMDILKGMLGADLIGFHTYDYQRHFISSVRRLLGDEIHFNQIHEQRGIIVADAFPMGIDYTRYSEAARMLDGGEATRSSLQHDLDAFFAADPERRLILSIDRMDYTKGIPNRLRAFELFLERYPSFRGKVCLVMLVVPSRDNVERYQILKRKVDELVGQINGRFGMINYTPIWYFYRSMPFENLVELYHASHVALITPVRDGMNLVAKEYVAARNDRNGVIIVSEMAGVSKEMSEALIINPYNIHEIADSIHTALVMPDEEQRHRLHAMQERLKRYDVFKWASEFLRALENTRNLQVRFNAKRLTDPLRAKVLAEYRASTARAIFLDYDGTLASFKDDPQAAKPEPVTLDIIRMLVCAKGNEVTIISGRDRATLQRWFAGIDVNLIAEHGVWNRYRGEDWEMLHQIDANWKVHVRPALESFVDRTPGSFIEEKNYSLVWHYRKAEPEQAVLRANELKDELTHLIGNHNLEIMEGNKVIEVKSGGINKGAAAMRFMGQKHYDFVFAAGDDWTDEFMFRHLPQSAVTVKVGIANTAARFNVESIEDMRGLLNAMSLADAGDR
jgi:trehalose 6-phosphate synthase/phosphatase